MPEDRARWRRALITGASAGIGEGFARRLAAQGVDLVLVARREDVLNELAAELVRDSGVAVEVLAADLATEQGVDAVAARLRAERDAVELLINNAGITTMGPLHRLDPARERTLVRLNTEAVLLLTQAHLARLSEHRSPGAVVNVASLSAFQPFPAMASYAATKAFVVALSESLAAAYASRGVHVQALCPGFVRTEMAHANDLDDAASRIPRALWLDVDTVVDACLDGLERGRVVVVPSWRYRVLHRATSLVPRSLRRRAMGTSRR